MTPVPAARVKPPVMAPVEVSIVIAPSSAIGADTSATRPRSTPLLGAIAAQWGAGASAHAQAAPPSGTRDIGSQVPRSQTSGSGHWPVSLHGVPGTGAGR